VSHSEHIVIRRAGGFDAETVHRLIVALAETMPGETIVRTTPEDFRRQLSREPGLVHGLLAERGSDAVGLCLWLSYFSSWRGPGVYIQDLFVDPRERSSGLGRQLLARAAADGARAGGCFIRLAVDIGNARAVPFYTRFGFTETIEDRMFMLGGEAFDRLAEEGAGNQRDESQE
jgi:GNAT superfamily N-acetyltransferase